MAITDGTAGSGLPRGTKTHIGGRPITIRDAAYLDDGTLAGSSLTMDRAFAKLTSEVGLSLSDAATVCATTPARALGLQGFGVIAAGRHGRPGRPRPGPPGRPDLGRPECSLSNSRVADPVQGAV